MDLNVNEIIQEVINSELGTDAWLTTSSPQWTKKIRVDFRNPYDQKNTTGIVYEGEEIYADAATADVSNAKQNDTLKVNSITYKITSVQPDEAGVTRLLLSKTS